MPDHDAADRPVGVLDIEDIAYERVPVRVTILGQRYVFNGWVAGPGCPGRVKAEYARIAHRLRISADSPSAAYQEYLTDALRVVFEAPAEQYDAIDLLAGDTDRAERILVHLKWHGRTTVEDDADPEARGGASTTDGSSPTSAPPSAVSAPTAAAG